MKRLGHSLFLLTIASLLLDSCSTQLTTASITKRHYRSGYFVDMGNAKHKTESIALKTIPVTTESAVIEKSPGTQITSANNISENTPFTTVSSSGSNAISKTKKDISKELTASTQKHTETSNLKQFITPNTLQEIKNIKAISKYIKSENKGHKNNHSLLWTIVVILLLLWIISYLMGGWGLGGILNLLLVIALILIILSLLGII